MMYRIVIQNDLVFKKMVLRLKNILINGYFEVREENDNSIHEIYYKISNEAEIKHVFFRMMYRIVIQNDLVF